MPVLISSLSSDRRLRRHCLSILRARSASGAVGEPASMSSDSGFLCRALPRRRKGPPVVGAAPRCAQPAPLGQPSALPTTTAGC